MGKYTIQWKGPNREFSKTTEDPLELIKIVISFHKAEIGRGIWLPNYWDKLTIEKHQKEKANVQSPPPMIGCEEKEKGQVKKGTC